MDDPCRQLAVATRQLAVATGQLAVATGQLAVATGQLAVATGQLAVATRGMHEVARRGIANCWCLWLLEAVDWWHVVLHLVAMDGCFLVSFG